MNSLTRSTPSERISESVPDGSANSGPFGSKIDSGPGLLSAAAIGEGPPALPAMIAAVAMGVPAAISPAASSSTPARGRKTCSRPDKAWQHTALDSLRMLTPVRREAAAAARADPAPPARPTATRSAAFETWLVAAILAVGAAIRFATIASQSYWVDEATTVHELHMSFGAMLHAVATNESTPPLYYVLAWGWTKVFGTGEAGLRSLSALAGAAVIPVIYLAGRELATRRAGALAALFAAVNPFVIWYSQEARAYMLFALLSALSFLFFARALRRGDRHERELIWWAVFSALAILTHFFAGFLLAPEAIWLLVALRSRAAALATAVLAAAQAALVPLLAGDLGHPLLQWITQFPLSIRIQQVPVAFGLGTLYLSPVLSGGLVAAGCLAAIVALLVLFGADSSEQRGALAATLVAAPTILVPLVLAELGHDYLLARNMIGAWIPLVVLVAIACTALRTLPAGAALAALLVGAF